MKIKNSIKAVVTKGEDGYFVGECTNIAVVTQGISVDETISNLKEAINLYFEDEEPLESDYDNELKLEIRI